ncbi:uncharacterized protein TRAVEDRAFT_27234, partial [Trametes versicolor FP-101664 SS1]|uniref:uncharacterized protein n=1 Tax=Trametes versicolor (strain FP-101664) TaxID=717944 RepID=UPI00046227AB
MSLREGALSAAGAEGATTALPTVHTSQGHDKTPRSLLAARRVHMQAVTASPPPIGAARRPTGRIVHIIVRAERRKNL